MIMLNRALITLFLFSLHELAGASTTATGDFNLNANGTQLPTSAGSIVLDLNSNGTISATLTSNIGNIKGFAIDTTRTQASTPESGFSDTITNTGGWTITNVGTFNVGFACFRYCDNVVSWIIGDQSHQFTSFADLLNGFKNVDFVFVDSSYGYHYASAQILAVPEPGSYALMLSGLGLVGHIARRKRQKAA